MKDEVRPKSSTIQAMETLRRMILSGDLPPGSDHLETELADRLGLSRTPVREATLMLQAQGLLEVRPRKGVRITAVTAEDMREIYEILTELESLAALRAAEARPDAAALAPLREAIERMEASLAAEDREAWAEADADFHDALMDMGGNRRLSRIVDMFNDQVRRARMVTLHLRPLPQKSNDDHRAVYEAIAAGDGPEARRLHGEHRRGAGELLTTLLEQAGLKRL